MGAIMPNDSSGGPLALDRPDDVFRVRDVLDRVGFDHAGLLERIGAGAMVDVGFGPLELPRILRRTREGDALATLIRVFLCGTRVSDQVFRRAIEPMDPAAWAGLGLIEREGDTVRRRVMFLPYGELVIAHDFPPHEGGAHRDQVLGVTRSTLTLARSIMQFPAEQTLDLGTGCGYLALKAAENSRHVLATDVNPRALSITKFNAKLNRIPNVETARGSLFEPAGDGKFELIGSNPPFVISPTNDLVYRDSGLERDAICERILRAAPAHLSERGVAQIMCNWVRIAGRDWLERLSEWFEGLGCDAWIVHWKSVEPGDYAQHWLLQTDPCCPPERFREEFDRWMTYYDEQLIEAIDVGLITLRRRACERNWMRVDTDGDPDHYSGAEYLAGFAGRDLVDQLDDDHALLGLKLTCRPELQVSQRLKASESGWRVDHADCRLGAGLPHNGEFTPTIFHLLTLCRGRLPVGAVLAQVAARLGQDEAAIRNECLAAVRDLALQGFLWPADVPFGPAAFDEPEVSPAGGYSHGA
jgi:predicted RNA methylase